MTNSSNKGGLRNYDNAATIIIMKKNIKKKIAITSSTIQLLEISVHTRHEGKEIFFHNPQSLNYSIHG